MRVLVVDDNPLNIELFQDTLEGAGHEVIVEVDALDGQRRALSESFDLIVLDIQMPRADGYTVCRALRASGMRSPIVALSSNALPEHIVAGLDAGFDAYLTKPITPAALREAVSRFGRAA